MSTPQLKYPHVRVQLSGLDPSLLAILGRVNNVPFTAKANFECSP